jgi:replicative superfamily II helicase
MRFQDVTQSYADATLNIALDTLAKGKQALVFCNTKRGAESQAEKIAQKVKEPQDAGLLKQIAQEILDAVQSPTKQCHRLAACVRRGIAFHHSGLNAKQREIVETRFRDSTIKIICATPTLAMGMDLPAYRSIIRDLKRYASGTSWGMADIPVLEYEQMCVPGETLIKTSAGDIPIREIVESEGEFSVLSYDTKRGTYSYQPVLAKYRRDAASLVHLRLARGYSLRLTGNHPVFAQRNGACQWIPAERLVKGDCVLLSAKSASVTTFDMPLVLPQGVYLPDGGLLINQLKQESGYSDKAVGSLIAVQKRNMYHYKHGKKALPFEKAVVLHDALRKKHNAPEYLKRMKSRYGGALHVQHLFTPEFFWLAGLIASDGTMTRCTDKRTGSRYVKVKIGNNDARIIAKAKLVLDKVCEGDSYVSMRDGRFMQLEKGATLLADILQLNFGIPQGKKSYSVRAPKILQAAPLDYVGVYLAGVFDGDGSYLQGRRVHFCTASECFAHDLQMLLLRLGIVCSLAREKAGQTNIIRGKKVSFQEGIYCIRITKKSSMNRFAQYVTPVKSTIAEEYSTYHNIDRFHKPLNDSVWLTVESVQAVPFHGRVYNIHVDRNNNYFADGILVHNCGRAGRPGKEDVGEAICIAETESEKERIVEKYIYGDPEDIYSKLAVEPVLRTYVLSLIASGYVHDRQSLYDFFDETFYAWQYEDTDTLHRILDRMIGLLAKWGFIEAPWMELPDVPSPGAPDFSKQYSAEFSTPFVAASDVQDGSLKATLLGERVAQLYLDPYTANHLLTALENGIARNLRLGEFPLLHLLSTTIEMRPLLSVKQGELDEIDRKLIEVEDSLFVKSPTIYSHEYEDFLQTVKTAMFLRAWVSETGEDVLFEEFNVRPGEVQAKREKADWLLYSLIELAKLKKWHLMIVEFEKMRVRLEYGAKEEILPLLRLKGIGRVRARKLFHNGIRSIDAVKNAELSTLKALIGDAVAASIKEQVGQKVSPEDLAVKRNKRKGQINLRDYGKE